MQIIRINDYETVISEFLSDYGYFIEIKIPTRYRRHFDELMKQ